MSSIPTFGGVPTRGETFAKLLHHLGEAQSMCAILAHLHNTEDTHLDRTLAHGWLGISELLKRLQHNVTEFAKRKMQ